MWNAMIWSIIYDPLPTPAGRSGRASMITGFVGWVILILAALVWGTSLFVEEANLNLSNNLRVIAGWIAGVCVVCYFIGILLAANGVTKLMNGIPDPGMKSIILGFALNGLPMILVALAAGYDKYAR
jgi:hypothetical protein